MGAKPGTKHHNSKLTEATVREIRRIWANRVTQKELAAKYGVDQSTIHDVVSWKSWRHVK